jgi:GT2 family glycosyltransferase
LLDERCWSFPITAVRGKHEGVSSARNLGARHASGNYLVFLDDDCRPRSDWLREIHIMVERYSDSLVGGVLVNGLVGNVYAETAQLILDMVYRKQNPENGPARFVAGANWTFKRSSYEELEGCNTSFPPYGAEDREFCDRWLASGRTIRVASGAIVDHYHFLDFRAFVKMYYCYGRGAYAYHQGRLEFGLAGASEKYLFYLDLPTILSPISRVDGISKKIKILGLMLAWQVANVFGYAREAQFRRRKRVSVCDGN